MPERDTELLQKMVELLQESAAYRRQAVDETLSKLKDPDRPDWKKQLEQAQIRAEEAQARVQEQRREDKEHQASMLTELKTISGLLRQLIEQGKGR